MLSLLKVTLHNKLIPAPRFSAQRQPKDPQDNASKTIDHVLAWTQQQHPHHKPTPTPEPDNATTTNQAIAATHVKLFKTDAGQGITGGLLLALLKGLVDQKFKAAEATYQKRYQRYQIELQQAYASRPTISSPWNEWLPPTEPKQPDYNSTRESQENLFKCFKPGQQRQIVRKLLKQLETADLIDVRRPSAKPAQNRLKLTRSGSHLLNTLHDTIIIPKPAGP